MIKKLLHIILLLFLAHSNTKSQSPLLDTFALRFKTGKTPEIKIKALSDLAYEYHFSNSDTALIICERGIKLAKKIKSLEFQATLMSEKGIYFHRIGQLDSSIKSYKNSQAIWLRLQNSKMVKQKKAGLSGEKVLLSNLANAYCDKGNFAEAIKCHYKALKMNEKDNDSRGMAHCLNGIGLVHFTQKNYEKAKSSFKQSLVFAKKAKYHYLTSSNYIGLGDIYNSTNNTDSAIYFLKRAYNISDSLNDLHSKVAALGNLGIAYKNKKDFTNAEKSFEEVLLLSRQLNNLFHVANTYSNLGSIKLLEEEFPLAEKYYLKALNLCDSVGAADLKMSCEFGLHTVYESSNQPKKALEHYKSYIILRDSLTNAENTKAQARTEMQYEFDKQQTADSIQTAERTKQEKIKHNQEIAQQKMYTYGGIIGFSLMLIVAFVSFRAFRNKQKANLIIQQQKQLVEEKQKEILDSIHYAKRIQQALLPSEKYIERNLNQLNYK